MRISTRVQKIHEKSKFPAGRGMVCWRKNPSWPLLAMMAIYSDRMTPWECYLYLSLTPKPTAYGTIGTRGASSAKADWCASLNHLYKNVCTHRLDYQYDRLTLRE